ncbi:ThiF family adenylyltransferase [Marinoscillum sp.]|uniref:ThiF family adenylyltransferase n=1 Tax=Marinoscillum sp. TaxID=2024838 RepID=UPI003BA9C262
MEENNRRYSRQVQLPEIGLHGQQKLQQSSVLIIGMGGLGCPAAQYLTAAGVGTLGLVDHDLVDETNLHRQILYGPEDIGQPKANAAQAALSRLNDKVTFNTYTRGLHLSNALEIISQYDLIIDGTDNFQTKYLINDACIKADKPWVYASIYKYEGQLSVFNYQDGPSYRCLFPKVPKEDISCEATGVLGVLPGILGTYQAAEALKVILEIGNPLSGTLKVIHTLTMQEQLISFSRDEQEIQQTKQKALSLEKLACELKDSHSVYLDVREPTEQPQPTNQNVLKIPMSQLNMRYSEIPKNREVQVYCQSGKRSQQAILMLSELGFDNLINVEGGIQNVLR